MGGGQYCAPPISISFNLICFPDAETVNNAADTHESQQRAERNAKTAEKVRYGQAISENGMGGKITEAGGNANQGKPLESQHDIARVIHMCP